VYNDHPRDQEKVVVVQRLELSNYYYFDLKKAEGGAVPNASMYTRDREKL